MAEINEETGEVIEPGDEPEQPVGEPTEAPEQDEPFEEPEEQTEAQAVAFDQLSEGEQSKIIDKLDREAERHTKRLSEIYAEEMLMRFPCELCNPRTAGWYAPAEIDEETRQRVRIAIGDREPVKRSHDRYSRRCEACDGEGEVETGSKVTGQTALPCIDCGGKGWVNVGPERLGGVKPVQIAPAQPNGEQAAEQPQPGPAPMSPEEQAAFDLLRARNYAVIAPVR